MSIASRPDDDELPPEHMPGPLPGSLAWHEEQMAKIPWWRLLARYQRKVAMELARERCLKALDDLSARLRAGSDHG